MADQLGRIEISLQSLADQIATIAGRSFDFAIDELICSECCTVMGFSLKWELKGIEEKRCSG